MDTPVEKPVNNPVRTSFFTSPFVSVSSIVLLSLVSFALGATWMMLAKGDFSGIIGRFQDTGDTQQVAEVGTKAIQDLAGSAAAIGINRGDLEKCVDESRYTAKIEADVENASSLGINGTPGGFVVDLQTGNALQLRGAMPYPALKSQVDTMLSDDTSSLTFFEGTPPQIRDEDHYRGSENPRIIVFEFSDYECPYCKQFHPTLQKLITDYDNIGWVYRHFPIESIHPLARPAAEASECVFGLGGEEAFWKYTDYLFEN